MSKQRLLPVNCYHTDYMPGTAIRLVQFYFEREGQSPLYLTTQEVIALSKIHARYVYSLQLQSVVVVVDEKISYNDYEAGYIATGTHPGSRHLVVCHHQYAAYRRVKEAKHRWHVYELDFSYQGSYNFTVWEDYKWVLSQAKKINYVRIRERLRGLSAV